MATLVLVAAIIGPTTVAGLGSGPGPSPDATKLGPGGWDHLGDGGTPGTRSLDGAVRALNTDAPGVMYVGGGFTNAGGIADADRIATWNGSAWGALGASSALSGGDVYALAYDNGRVFAGGTFTNAGGNADADYLAVWNGTSWAPFCNAVGPAFNNNVKALQIIGSTLYVGGEYQNGAGLAAADYLLACDLNTGAASPTVSSDGDFSGAVNALTADSAGNLYAAGTFINLDGIPAADYVAAYNGANWSAMGSGAPNGGAVDGISRALFASETDVYLGTDALNVAGIAQADHVAKWDGSAWSALGSNASGDDGWFPVSTSISGITISSSLVFVIGAFQNADGDSRADVVAAFDEGEWIPVGSNGAGDGPLNASGHVLDVFDQDLYAGGSFTSAGGDALAQFAASFALNQLIPTPTPTVSPSPQPVPTPTATPAPPQGNLSGPKSQELGGTIVVEVGCDVACTAIATGRLSVPGVGKAPTLAKDYKLGKATKQVPAGGSAKLKLKVPKKARGAAAKALKQGKKVTAKITVKVEDTSGNSSSKNRTVKLTP